MKQLLCIIACLYPLFSIAQINIKMDFNKDNKIVYLTLENETDDSFILVPMESPDTTRYSTVRFIYKDKQGAILSRKVMCINDDQWIKENGHWKLTWRKGRVLLHNAKNEYIYKPQKLYIDNDTYELDVIVQIKAHSVTIKKTYDFSLKKSFLW